MIGGLVGSLVVLAIGTILDFAVATGPHLHGFDIRTVGFVLMIAGATGAVLSALVGTFGAGGRRRHGPSSCTTSCG